MKSFSIRHKLNLVMASQPIFHWRHKILLNCLATWIKDLSRNLWRPFTFTAHLFPTSPPTHENDTNSDTHSYIHVCIYIYIYIYTEGVLSRDNRRVNKLIMAWKVVIHPAQHCENLQINKQVGQVTANLKRIPPTPNENTLEQMLSSQKDWQIDR